MCVIGGNCSVCLGDGLLPANPLDRAPDIVGCAPMPKLRLSGECSKEPP
jgi:hypothetical protein